MSQIDPQYSISAQQSDISNAVMPSSARRAQPAKSSLVNIVSQSSTQQAGGQVLINLGNTPNTFIKNGSVYMRFRLAAKTTAAATADQWVRSGSALTTASRTAQASSGLGTWSSVISRCTVSAGGQVIEQINNYNVYHEALLLHTSGNYGLQDMPLLEGGYYGDSAVNPDAFKIANGTAANVETTGAWITIPLFLGCFNAQDNKDFPLGLMQGGIQILIDLSPDAIALTAGVSGGGVPTYTVASASLSYEAVQVSSEYMNAMRAQLAQEGQLFQMPFVSALLMNVASSSTLDVTYGVGLSSVKSVLFTKKATATVANPKYSICDTSNNLRVYADGQLQNMYQISDVATFYAELNRAFGNLASRTSTSGVADMLASYPTQYFWGGVAFNKFNEAGLAMTGTSCSQLQFHVDAVTNNAATAFIAIFYDAILTVSPMSGESAVIR